MLNYTIGSLASGYGGLEMGLQAALPGGRVLWHAEIDPAASRVLAYRHPGVPNLGEITAVDWWHAPQVDWLTAGYPCRACCRLSDRPFAHQNLTPPRLVTCIL